MDGNSIDTPDDRSDSQHADTMSTTLVAMVMHDMRTALSGIVGATGLLTDSIERSGRAEDVEALRALEGAGDILTRLLDDAMDLSQLEAGALQINEQLLDTKRFLHKTAGLWAERFESHGIKFTAECEAGAPPAFESDPARLRQCLGNLLSNAIKYSQADQVCLRARTDGAKGIEFTVVDNGTGFSDPAREQAFFPFRRPSGQARGGTGLGLSIVQALMARLGGSVELTTAQGTGSKVTLSVPNSARDEKPPPTQAEPRPSPDALLGVHILLVEDNATNRLIAERMLAQLGAEVTSTETGGTGLIEASENEYLVILIDIDLPDMDGCEVIRQIRDGDGPNADSCLLAFTAFALEESKAEMRAAGVDAIITKPVRGPEDFLRPLRELGVAEFAEPQRTQINEDALAGFHAALGDDGFEELLQEFRRDIDLLIADLSAEDVTPEQVSRVAHITTSIAGAIGASAPRDAAAALQAAKKEGGLGELDGLTQTLLDSLRTTAAALRDYRRS